MAMSRNARNRKAKGVARHETRPLKIKFKVRTQPLTSQPARVYPAQTHHRPNPYTPTLQIGGAFPKERGNAPAGVSDAVWAKAYNCANSYVYDREAISTRVAVAKKARQDGLIRDLAIERLIRKGVLSKDFIDASP